MKGSVSLKKKSQDLSTFSAPGEFLLFPLYNPARFFSCMVFFLTCELLKNA